MSKKRITPRLAQSLRLLGASQLQAQGNQRALSRKGPLLGRAQTFLVAAILVELAGQVVR